jgi:hypothetical protein
MEDADTRMPLPVTPEEVRLAAAGCCCPPGLRLPTRAQPSTPRLPSLHLATQLEFLAEQELVTIVPSFSINPDVAPDGVLPIGSVSGAIASPAACAAGLALSRARP